MDEQTKLNIILYNEQLGIKTKFFSDDNILSYNENGTIYINESIEHDYEQTNLNEIGRVLEKSEGFKKLEDDIATEYLNGLEEVARENEMVYANIEKEKKQLTGQDIGQAFYDADVELCDEAQREMENLIGKQKEQEKEI